MHSFSKTLRLLSLIGILFCMSCGQRQADDAATKVKVSEKAAEEEKIAKEEAAFQKNLSNLAERHNAQSNWLAFVEKNIGDGEGRATLTLEFQDALKRLKGQPILVIGHIIDVYENGQDYRILCDCYNNRPPDFNLEFGSTTFEIDADAEAARYVVEMRSRHSSLELVFPEGKTRFAFVVHPTGLTVTHNRRIVAEGHSEGDGEDHFVSAEIVRGDLFPKCKILGRCLEVRCLSEL